MAKKTEYLIIQYASDGSIAKQLRAPKGVNLRLLLERLICKDLDDDAVINSCRLSNAKLFYDPFKIDDMRKDHHREQAREVFFSDNETDDPLGVYDRAWQAQIKLGKPLVIAGLSRNYVVKEIEV